MVLHGARRRRQLDVEGDGPSGYAQVLDEPEGDDVPVKIRVLDHPESLQDVLLPDPASRPAA